MKQPRKSQRRATNKVVPLFRRTPEEMREQLAIIDEMFRNPKARIEVRGRRVVVTDESLREFLASRPAVR